MFLLTFLEFVMARLFALISDTSVMTMMMMMMMMMMIVMVIHMMMAVIMFTCRIHWSLCASCTHCWRRKTCSLQCGSNELGCQKSVLLSHTSNTASLNRLSSPMNRWCVSIDNWFKRCKLFCEQIYINVICTLASDISGRAHLFLLNAATCWFLTPELSSADGVFQLLLRPSGTLFRHICARHWLVADSLEMG